MSVMQMYEILYKNNSYPSIKVAKELLDKYKKIIKLNNSSSARENKKICKQTNRVYKEMSYNKSNAMNKHKVFWTKTILDGELIVEKALVMNPKIKWWNEFIDTGCLLTYKEESGNGLRGRYPENIIGKDNILNNSTLMMIMRKQYDDVIADVIKTSSKLTDFYESNEATFWCMNTHGERKLATNWWESSNSTKSKDDVYTELFTAKPNIFAAYLMFNDFKFNHFILNTRRTREDFNKINLKWKKSFAQSPQYAERCFNYEKWFKYTIFLAQIMKMQIKYDVPLPFTKEEMIAYGGEDIIDKLLLCIDLDYKEESELFEKREQTWRNIDEDIRKRKDYHDSLNEMDWFAKNAYPISSLRDFAPFKKQMMLLKSHKNEVKKKTQNVVYR